MNNYSLFMNNYSLQSDMAKDILISPVLSQTASYVALQQNL